MIKKLSSVVLAVAGFALGVVVQHFHDIYPHGAVQTAQTPAASGGVDLAAAPHGPVNVDFAAEPLWAYGFDTPALPGDKAVPQALPVRIPTPTEEQKQPRTLQGSQAQYSIVDIRDLQNVIDWFPGDHPPMPDIIKHGPAGMGPAKRGCGSCHLPNGLGRPENAAPAALPAAYIVRQLHEFRGGLRYTADPRKPNTNTMIDLAKGMTDEEIADAAAYFSAMKWQQHVRVIETDLVPKTRIQGNLFIPTSEEKTEPIAGRIIEVPENEERNEVLRDPRAGFIAYVPKGSLAKGKELVTLGGATIVNNQIVQGKTTACTACHGQDLMGVAPDVPAIAGRSPSYMVRQLFDIQQGTRNGAQVQLMKLVVAKLTGEDLVAVAAYVASRFPPTQEAAATISMK